MQIIAHRGRVGDNPENCIESLCLLTSGVEGVEVDVRVTADGMPILMHDQGIERTTNGSGAVADLYYQDLMNIKLEDRYKVPCLKSYLTSCQKYNFANIFLDVKVVKKEELRAIVETVKKSRLYKKIICLVKDKESLSCLRKLDPSLALGLLRTELSNLDEHLTTAKLYRAEVLLVMHGDEAYMKNRSVVAAIRKAGFKAGASVINSIHSYRAALQDQCHLVLTDRQDIFKSL